MCWIEKYFIPTECNTICYINIIVVIFICNQWQSKKFDHCENYTVYSLATYNRG